MDHKQLKAFLTIAETGNMTRAAELLNVVQPAVSRQLRLLEEDLGVALFHRERYGMALTAAGKSMLGYARRAMLELDRARAELEASSGDVAGIVSVGLLPSTCDVVANRLVSAVAQAYPGIRMQVSQAYAGALRQGLENGDIDVALVYGVEHAEHIQATALLIEPLWVVGPPGTRLRPNRPVALADLAATPMVLPNGPHGIRTLVDHACAVSGVQLRIAVETNAMSLQKSLAVSGHGLTLMPPIAFARELAAGELTAAPLSEPRITRTLMLALPSHRVVGRHVQHVADLLAAIVKQAVHDSAWPHARWTGS